MRRLLVSRLAIESGAAAAVETPSFYAFFAAVVVTGLRLVHFPLTAFTLPGGALAIGIGFGSQNVMNNFISGLILMLERPVRIGDLREAIYHGAVQRVVGGMTASFVMELIVYPAIYLVWRRRGLPEGEASGDTAEA